jgi:hypothetical protein
LTQRDRPSEEIADLAKITTKRIATPIEIRSDGRLFGKFSNQRVKIVTPGGPLARDGHRSGEMLAEG